MNPQSPSSSSSSEAERDAFEADVANELPLLTDDKLIAAACATADGPLDHEHIARYLPKWRSFVRHLAEQGNSGAVEAEQFLDAGVADVQDESGISTYYSKGAALECINAALEHIACEKVIAAQNRRDGIEVSGLHPATVDLVRRFSVALAEKLAAAEEKYGYSDGWLQSDWMDECRAKLLEHIDKGDPRDVAAYCAFLWHHGEATNEPLPISPKEWREQAKARYIEMGDDEATATECATYLCQQQDWLGGEIHEPRNAVQDDLRERPMPAVSTALATPPSLPIDFKQASDAERNDDDLLQCLHNELYRAQRTDRVKVLTDSVGKARLLLSRYRDSLAAPSSLPETVEGKYALWVQLSQDHELGPVVAAALGEQLRGVIAAHPRKQASEQGGWQWVPKEPTPAMLDAIVHSRFPEDWQVGKRLQHAQAAKGSDDRVPPQTEYEIAVGQYQRMLAAAPSPHPEEGALLLGGDHG